MIYITSSSSDKKPGVTGFGTGQAKTGGTGFTKPVAPVSACGAQLGAQRPERKKGGLGKVEGDAVMLTPCLVCAEKDRRTERDA